MAAARKQVRRAGKGPSPSGTLTICFTDIAGSTAIAARLGDVRWAALLDHHEGIVRGLVEAHGGRTVKSQGDGVMAAFPSARGAVAFATALQRELARPGAGAQEERLAVRIGLHTGDAEPRGEDLLGRAVIQAARTCAQALPGEILVSSLVRELVEPAGEVAFGESRTVELKGIPGSHGLHPVGWRPGEEASPAARPAVGPLQGILRTRLLPPRLPPDCVARPDLVAAVEQGLRGRLVAVVAGAGYGKTTLLAEALAESEWQWVWCSCDQRLSGAQALVAHLAAGLSARFPGFGAQLAPGETSEEQITSLWNEVAETIAEDFVVALDDVHLLPEPSLAALIPLLETAPPNVHVVLSGRTPLPSGLTRLAPGRIVEIDEAALSFSLEETDLLLRSVQIELPAADLEALRDQTEGWAAGLLLAAQSTGAARRPFGRDAAHFAYLAEEVVMAQPEDVRRFLEDTSILGRFSPSLAGAVTGREDAAELLRDLVARHLFTVRLDDEGEWYRYHHLLREFLRARLAEGGAARAAELHERAATWWIGAEQPTEAVPHVFAAGELDRVVEVLEPVAEALATGPSAGTLATWLDALPTSAWADRPGLLLAHASLLLTRGEHEASFSEYERAVGRLLEMGEKDRASAAFLSLQFALLLAGTRPHHRIEVGRRWSDRIPPDAVHLPVARLLVAGALGYACRFDEARDEFRVARDLPAARGSPIIKELATLLESFYVDFWFRPTREVIETVGASRRALVDARDSGSASLVPFITMLDSYLQLQAGDHARGLEIIDEFFEEAQRVSVQRSASRSAQWVRFTAFAGLGRWEEFDREYVPGPEGADSAVSSSYSYRYRAPAARLAAHFGRREQALREIARARDEMAAFGHVSDDSAFHCEFAHAARALGEVGLAGVCAADALAAAEEMGSPTALARAALVSAVCADDDDAVDGLIETSLDLTHRHGLELVWTHRERGTSVPLLVRAIERSIGPPGLAETLLAGSGADALAHAVDVAEASPQARARIAEIAGGMAEVNIETVDRLLRDRDAIVREAARRSWTRLKSRPRASITIRVLGELRVERDGTEVPPSAFARQRARALLAALVVAGGPIHRETLCEWLWPDLLPERAAAALRTTLHDLRRAIEPELEASSSASVLVADGENVRLALGAEDRLDLVEFERLAERRQGEPEEILARLSAAEALYRAPLLQEWPYEEWALARRERIEEAFDEVLERASRAALDAGRPDEAIGRLRRLVRRQPEREGAHRLLMSALAAAGERALALRQYHACRAALRREQGIEPGEATRELYSALLRDDPAPRPDSMESVMPA